MSHAQKTKWCPTASLHNIKLRASLYQKIRTFFAEKNVLEVETPLLSQYTVTDQHIESFPVKHKSAYFLQTSPEYAMKRLLASGTGAIFQICKAFRQEESGSQHNPEFTMLEWYRPGFDHHRLMQEVDLFFQAILQTQPAEKISYQALLLKHLSIDPLNTDINTLHALIKKNKITIDLENVDFDTSLQILLTHLIEPKLGIDRPLFLYDFPKSQAALAKIRNNQVAERFEAYIAGSEIANGFHELTNSAEQKERFITDQKKRRINQQYVPDIDQRLIEALDNNFPDCAGVAIGIDRLLMQMTNAHTIQEVISFPWERA